MAAMETLPTSLRVWDGEATVDFDAEDSAEVLGLREGFVDAELLRDPAADALPSPPDCELFGVCEPLDESEAGRVFDSRDDMLDEKAADSEEDARVDGEEEWSPDGVGDCDADADTDATALPDFEAITLIDSDDAIEAVAPRESDAVELLELRGDVEVD